MDLQGNVRHRLGATTNVGDGRRPALYQTNAGSDSGWAAQKSQVSNYTGIWTLCWARGEFPAHEAELVLRIARSKRKRCVSPNNTRELPPYQRKSTAE